MKDDISNPVQTRLTNRVGVGWKVGLRLGARYGNRLARATQIPPLPMFGPSVYS